LKRIKFKDMSKLELLLFVFTLSFYILFLIFIIYTLIHQDYKGFFWRFLFMPGLSTMAFLQGFNFLIKKDASSKVVIWLSFGVGIFILLLYLIEICFPRY
jgi:hypothetical protein